MREKVFKMFLNRTSNIQNRSSVAAHRTAKNDERKNACLNIANRKSKIANRLFQGRAVTG